MSAKWEGLVRWKNLAGEKAWNFLKFLVSKTKFLYTYIYIYTYMKKKTYIFAQMSVKSLAFIKFLKSFIQLIKFKTT